MGIANMSEPAPAQRCGMSHGLGCARCPGCSLNVSFNMSGPEPVWIPREISLQRSNSIKIQLRSICEWGGVHKVTEKASGF